MRLWAGERTAPYKYVSRGQSTTIFHLREEKSEEKREEKNQSVVEVLEVPTLK